MSTAERISEMFADDGQVWKTADGRILEIVCGDELGVVVDFGPHGAVSDIERFIFEDGSVITIAGDGWDFGYRDCFCWTGAGHDPVTCEVQANRDPEYRDEEE